MTVKEMFELAKAGYKPSEIAEMHNLMKEADPEPKEEPKQEPEAEPEEEPKEEPKEEPIQEPDYKKLYEESQEKLAAAQKANVNKNMAGSVPSDEDILTAAVRSFM